MDQQNKYIDALKYIASPLQRKRLMYGEWLAPIPEEEHMRNALDVITVMKKLGMTYSEVMQLSYREFQQWKGN